MTKGASFGSVSLVLCTLMLLSACGHAAHDKNAPEGKREAILAPTDKKIAVDPNLKGFDLELHSPQANATWTQGGGHPEHSLVHPDLNKKIDEVWTASVGSGSTGTYRLLAQPVVAEDKIFTMDARGRVTARTTSDGDRLWRFDTTPDDRDTVAMGGGLAYGQLTLFATTGFGEVLALSPKDGSVLWRKMIGKPLRAAPTYADRTVYVVTIDNELHALNASNGEEYWRHAGLTESSTLMGASSPAASGDNLIVAYSSGEIYNLRAQTGRPAWSDVLGTQSLVGALPAIADIRGLPVIDHGTVFAVSHSGRTAAIDLRTGDRTWEADIGGVNTPAIVGNMVVIATNEPSLVALTRDTGRVLWVQDLQKRDDPSDRDSDAVFWSGPVLAGSQLWLTNSLGKLIAHDIITGKQTAEIDLGSPSFIAPIVAGKTLYAITDDGTLTALR